MTIREYLKEKTALLARAGIDDAESEAFLCFEDSSGMPRAQIRLSLEKALADCFPADVISKIDDCFLRRAEHEPLAYIVRKAPFFDLEFAVGPGVLIPRFDTEILVETALGCLGFEQMLPGSPKLPIVCSTSAEKSCNTVTRPDISAFALSGAQQVYIEEPIPKRPLMILDLCTGSGCVGITIAHELQKKGIAFGLTMTDISEEAAAYAEENAKRILGGKEVSEFYPTAPDGVYMTSNKSLWQVVVTDLWPKAAAADSAETEAESVDEEKYDLIVSNPPYVTKEEMAELMPEVKEHEPALALTDGGDGLLIYRRIAEGLKDYLAPGGVIAVEHGCEQGEAVRNILSVALEKADAETPGEDRTKVGTGAITIKDYGDNDRVTCGGYLPAIGKNEEDEAASLADEVENER
ncbi:MAG: peptide chain release factor N(5)-glutamine methyltransferase [Clostridiales bacterium]|nr:peptide chain release factor N(5)-glutamine methyltransferase [Clostridiales bacterium]